MTSPIPVRLLLLAIAVVAEPALAQSGAPDHRSLIFELLPGFRADHFRTRQLKNDARPAGGAPDSSAPAAGAKVYKFATVDYPGAALSIAYDSNVSTSVGAFQYNPSGTSPTPATAFTLKGGVYKILAIPGSKQSAATGINTSGQIVGFYIDSSSNLHGFLDTAGTVTNVDYPGGTATEAKDVNDSGEIVGVYADALGTHGFLDNAGTFTSFDYPGASQTEVTAINLAGDMVGVWIDASSVFHGFLLSGGTYTALDFPLSAGTVAEGINDSGEISGYYLDSSNAGHGFVYSAGAFTTVDVVGAASTELARIKNNGTLNGVFEDALSEQHGLRGH